MANTSNNTSSNSNSNSEQRSKMNGQKPTSQTSASETSPHFSVNSIYVKDLSFEAPRSPFIFNEDWHPEMNFDLQLGSQILDKDKGLYEVLLHLTLTVKIKEESTAFLIDLKQAGIFVLTGFEENTLKELLATMCPTVIFPYARETVSNLVQRGGFPQLILPAINFDAMYEQHLKNEQQGLAGKAANQSADH